MRGPQIAFLIHEYFWVTDTHEFTLDVIDLIHVTQRGGDVHGFDTRWDEVLLSLEKTVFPLPKKSFNFTRYARLGVKHAPEFNSSSTVLNDGKLGWNLVHA